MSDIDTPDADEIAAKPSAVLASIGGDFRGIKLGPVTPMLEPIAQAMGMKWPSVGKDAFEQFKETGVYPGALMDTAIFTYLRTLSREGLESAAIAPRKALLEALEWASRNKIAGGSKAFKEAFELFKKAMIDIARATAEPDLPATGKVKKKRTPRRG